MKESANLTSWKPFDHILSTVASSNNQDKPVVLARISPDDSRATAFCGFTQQLQTCVRRAGRPEGRKCMNRGGLEFLEKWIQTNITDAEKHGTRERAKELAERCIAEAAVFEISLDDLEPKWGNIETIIYEAMVHLNEPGTPGK